MIGPHHVALPAGWPGRAAAGLAFVGIIGTATFASTANIHVPTSHAGVEAPGPGARCIVHHVEIDCRLLSPTPTHRRAPNPHPIVTPHVGRAPVPVPSPAAASPAAASPAAIPVSDGGGALP